MNTTMKIAIETYAKLTERTVNEVLVEIKNENKTVIDNIMKLMFSVSL